MPLLNLDKIILHHTVIGIACPGCGGQLVSDKSKRGLISRLWGKRSGVAARYCCKSCHRRFVVRETGR